MIFLEIALLPPDRILSPLYLLDIQAYVGMLLGMIARKLIAAFNAPYTYNIARTVSIADISKPLCLLARS